jgi:hypothetical protein
VTYAEIKELITRYDRPHKCKGCGSVENWIMVTSGLEPRDTYFKCMLCGKRNDYVIIESEPIKVWMVDPEPFRSHMKNFRL